MIWIRDCMDALNSTKETYAQWLRQGKSYRKCSKSAKLSLWKTKKETDCCHAAHSFRCPFLWKASHKGVKLIQINLTHNFWTLSQQYQQCMGCRIPRRWIRQCRNICQSYSCYAPVIVAMAFLVSDTKAWNPKIISDASKVDAMELGSSTANTREQIRVGVKIMRKTEPGAKIEDPSIIHFFVEISFPGLQENFGPGEESPPSIPFSSGLMSPCFPFFHV